MITFTHRGVRVEAYFSPKVPATWLDPPEGGDLESLEWEVEDIDEVMEGLDYSESVTRIVCSLWHRTGIVAVRLKDRIEAEFGLEDESYERHTENGDDEE